MIVYAMFAAVRLFNKKFYFYFLKELLGLFALSVGIFTFIMILSRLGKLTELVINKGVDISDIVLLIIYSAPSYLTFTLPMAFLLSTIVVLGRQSSENELLALKANGIDLRYLFVPVLALAVGIFLVGVFDTTLLLSKSSEAFRNTLFTIAKKGISIDDREGVFNDSIPGIVVYIDKVDTKTRKLSGIILSDDRDETMKQTISAEKGFVNLDATSFDLSFMLENGAVHRWEKQNDSYQSLSFKNYVFAMNLMTILPYNRELRKRPHEMNLAELRRNILKADASHRYDLYLEVYKKFSIPFSSIAFVPLIVPLGIRRKTEGKFSGVVYSLFLFLSYYILTAFTENMGKSFQVSPAIVAFVPNFLFCVAGFFIMRGLNAEAHISMLQRLRSRWGRLNVKA
jgi:lipopolysaccharide export system permease protein